MKVSAQREIEQIQMPNPHVVILGAGASYAAFPNGDKNGAKLPLMNNLVDILGLRDLLSRTQIDFETDNFEEIYSRLDENDAHQGIRNELEKVVYDYFSRLEIENSPTIYDHLLLSLREKDVVATFNWDPFLLQAYRRNCKKFNLPLLLFLHGNVAIGYCQADKVVGKNGHICSQCGCFLKPTKLLYPTANKGYHLDAFISSQWKALSQRLEKTFMISLFGYGAPQSDASAIDLMKSAWGSVDQREMEQTEIIDLRSKDDLRATWEPFIHTHHYETHSSFYDSWIANHPRRTGEAYINQYYKAQFIDNNPIPKELGLEELWTWFGRLKEVEDQNGHT